jgi:hypothetical protein
MASKMPAQQGQAAARRRQASWFAAFARSYFVRGKAERQKPGRCRAFVSNWMSLNAGIALHTRD